MNDLSGSSGENTVLCACWARRLRRGLPGEHITTEDARRRQDLVYHLSQEGAASFYMRAQTVAGLLHPHIVRVSTLIHGSNDPC